VSGLHYDPFKVNDPAIVATLHALALRSPEPREQVYLCSGVRKPYRIASTSTTYGEFDQLVDARDFLRLLLAGNPELELLS